MDNVFGRRRALASFIDEGCVDSRVIEELLPNGIPLPDEDLLWDYKEMLPVLGDNPGDEEKTAHKFHMAEIVKDAVSFYNSYGGYLVIGVRDSDKSVCGFDKNFDVNDLCKKIHGATRETIDVKFRLLDLSIQNRRQTIGILFIPQRPRANDPVQFLKDSPTNKSSKRAYTTNDIYMRSREECRRATTAADFALLFNRTRLSGSNITSQVKYIENNLPSKDPNLIELVGREVQLDELWRWFVDRYTAVKLLSGPGGVGKTSIAWTFCDAVTKAPPDGLEKVVWLTAKKRTYAALLGKYVEISHTHFTNLESLLLALLGELGVPENQLPEEPSREDLIEECISTLKIWPCLLVIDDVDSLPTEQQYDVFRTISTIFDRVIAAGGVRARVLLTARLNLGAAPGQLLPVSGLSLEDFREYVIDAAAAIGAPLPQGAALTTSVRSLHEASSGSPLFAASILRLVCLGEPINRAIRQHLGAEGEEVRRFAFERELDNLTDNQLRLLFAATHLGDCTIDELTEATQGNRALIRDDIGSLRDYHLMSLGAPADGFARDEPMVSMRREIAAMVDVVRKKISDPNVIETRCAKINRRSGSNNRDESLLFSRVLRYWAEKDFPLALEAAQHASKQIPTNPDIWCLLGRAYLLTPIPDARKADAALRKAAEMGSQRQELLPMRLKAKEMLGDWVGIKHLLEGQKRLPAVDTVLLAQALQALANEEARIRNFPGAEKYYLRGATLIQSAFNEQRAHGAVEALKALKADLSVAYVEMVVRRVVVDDQKIEIWEAVAKTMQLGVSHRGITAQGIQAAVSWCSAAARRDRVDVSTFRRMQSLLSAMRILHSKLEERGESWSAIANNLNRAMGDVSASTRKYEGRLRQYEDG